MNETWLQVPGFDAYVCSNTGRFKRRTLSGFRELKGTVNKRTGYQQIGLVRGGKQEWSLAHRLIASAFLSIEQLNANPGQFLTVNHKNRNRLDNRIENLELVSMAQNNSDWRKHPLHTLKEEPL